MIKLNVLLITLLSLVSFSQAYSMDYEYRALKENKEDANLGTSSLPKKLLAKDPEELHIPRDKKDKYLSEFEPLEDKIVKIIMSHLGFQDLKNFSQTSKRMYKLANPELKKQQKELEPDKCSKGENSKAYYKFLKALSTQGCSVQDLCCIVSFASEKKEEAYQTLLDVIDGKPYKLELYKTQEQNERFKNWFSKEWFEKYNNLYDLSEFARYFIKDKIRFRGKLQRLYKGAFKDLVKLDKLCFVENQLEEIEPYAFDGLDCLVELTIYNNNLKHLNEEIFRGLHSLQELSLSHNNIEQLNAKTFIGLDNLIKLDLNHNNIKNLEPAIFHSLAQLKELDLSHNNIEQLNAKAFIGLDNLIKLNLNHNKLKNLEPSVFYNVPCVKWLDLSNNPLDQLNPDALVGLSFLEQLYLNNRCLQQSEQEIATLDQMAATEWFEMDGIDDNIIANILHYLDHKSLLKFALMSKRMLLLVKSEFGRRQNGIFEKKLSNNGQTLDLSNTNLKHIYPGAFSGFKNVIYLILQLNKLKTLEPGLFDGLTSLKQLCLNENELEEISIEALKGLGNLIFLDIQRNRLKPGNIQQLEKIFPRVTITSSPQITENILKRTYNYLFGSKK